MNKDQILLNLQKACTELGIDSAKDLVVSAGTALVFHGIRQETADIDVTVTPLIFDKIPIKSIWDTTYKVFIKADETLLIDWHLGEPDVWDTVIVDGIRAQSLQEILKFKKKLNRPKDQADIKAIEKILKLPE